MRKGRRGKRYGRRAGGTQKYHKRNRRVKTYTMSRGGTRM